MDNDLTKIQELRQKDVKFSKAGDVKGLLSLWSDDGVLLLKNQNPITGIDNIKKYFNSEINKDIEITKYSFDFRETKIIGDFAYEWGFYDHQYRDPETKELIDFRGKLIRILRKEQGTWKAACVMGC